MATKYDITKLATLLSGDVVDSTTGKKRSMTDEEKREKVAEFCSEMGIDTADFSGELKILMSDVKTATKKVCGVIHSKDGNYVSVTRKSIGSYLTSYVDNFLNDESVRKQDNKEKYFEFLMGEKATYLDEETCKGLLAENMNRAKNAKFGKTPDLLDIANAVVSYNEAVSTREYVEKIYKNCVANGVDIYQSAKTLEENYNSYASDDKKLAPVESFYAKNGGFESADPSVSGRGQALVSRSLADFVDTQISTGRRVTKTEVKNLNTEINKAKVAESSASEHALDLKPVVGESDKAESSNDKEGHDSNNYTDGQYKIPKRGFFARVGRWMGRHPFLTSLITVGTFIVTGGLINPVFMLSNIATMILACGGGLVSVAAGGGIVRAVSPKYKNFIYNYDIEKYFKKIKKNNIKAETTLDIVKGLVGEKEFEAVAQVKPKTTNIETNKAKAQKIEELVGAGKVDNDTIAQVKAIADARKKKVGKAIDNSKKMDKIQALLTKKQINAVDLGVENVKDSVADERKALRYEQLKQQQNNRDYTNMLHIARYKKNAEESTTTKDDEPLVK